MDAVNHNTLDTIKEKMKEHINYILIGVAIFGVVLCIVAGMLPKTQYITFDDHDIVTNYTDCTRYVPGDILPGAQTKCKDYLKEKNATGGECICSIQLEIIKPMNANVTAYYELEGYEQIVRNYSQSRDDNQLAGRLSPEPSESCGSYTYACTGATATRMPIAPCGRLADAMFNDTFTLQTNNTYVLRLLDGLISEDDKKQFHNPAGNLSEAFRNFSKPMSWTQNVWELDTSSPDNNGFQNERFIIWMTKTDVIRKPAWRVNHTGVYATGLPAANYSLKVSYVYPKPRFGGRRKFIIKSFDGYEVGYDYTDCTKFKSDKLKCEDHIHDSGANDCSCYIQLEITKLMKAPVTAYYELDAYKNITNLYSESRDDDQLAGRLSPEPSESCGSYTYACTGATASRQPIAPCGRIADAMFNDTFNLEINNKPVTYYRYGLISEDDKKQFHNPEPAGNLSEAFRNFSKPMSWKKNVWELDTSSPDNNGFRNEQFIIWMKTDLKRKPVWRVNHTGVYEKGLPAGNYTLKVTYDYSTSRFGVKRKFIISSREKIVTLGRNLAGVALLVIGLLCFIAASGILLYRHWSCITKWF